MMGKRTFHASVILIFFRVIHAFCEKYGLFPMRRFSMKNTFSLRGLFGMKKRDDFSPEPYAVPVTLAYSHIGGMAKTFASVSGILRNVGSDISRITSGGASQK